MGWWKMEFSDLENAFFYVGSAAPYEHTAMICTKTGQVSFKSELSGIDEIPEEAYDSDSWQEVPHKNELGLGRDLVFSFVTQKIPADLDRVRSFFDRRGAYSSYKALLEKRGLLEEWYEFENAHQKEAILQWCRDVGIEVTE